MPQPTLFDLMKRQKEKKEGIANAQSPTTPSTAAAAVASPQQPQNGSASPAAGSASPTSSGERKAKEVDTPGPGQAGVKRGRGVEEQPKPIVEELVDTDDEKEQKDLQATAAPATKRQRQTEENTSTAKTAPAQLQVTKEDIANVTATTMAELIQGIGEFDPYYFTAWPREENGIGTPFAFFADVLADISSTSGRLQCTLLLTKFLWSVLIRSPNDILPAVYMTANKLAPAHEGIELGIGDAMLVKAIAEICGLTEARVRELYKQGGDLAEVAQTKKAKVSLLTKPKPLKLADVFKGYKDIATASGTNVQQRRIGQIKRLMRDAKGAEANFLIRGLQGKMRIGMAENTVVQSLAYSLELAALGSAQVKKMAKEKLQAHLTMAAEQVARAYHEVPSFDLIVPYLVQHGIPSKGDGVSLPKELSIRPGLPVRPMLAHPTTGITKILDRFQGKKFTCEYKYDGERAQIHFVNGVFSIFSRNSETHTTKYPDIIHMMPGRFNPDKNIESFILDTEAVAIGSEGELQAFQVLQHRSRKAVTLDQVTIPVCVFAFDILFLNGEPLRHLTLQERRAILQEMFVPQKGKLLFATALNSDDVEEVQAFLNQSVVDGCEGLMVKTLVEDAAYHPAKRSYSWLKLKKDYMEGCGDTLDLVPIGAFYGKGKRTGVLGGFVLACYDSANDEYQSICKIGTGFSDEMLEHLTNQLMPHTTEDQPRHYVTGDFKPDLWIQEHFVWEVKAADLSISPVHKAAMGIVNPDKGIALRFPRFLQVREDKGPHEATSANQVAELYRAQALTVNNEPPIAEDE